MKNINKKEAFTNHEHNEKMNTPEPDRIGFGDLVVWDDPERNIFEIGIFYDNGKIWNDHMIGYCFEPHYLKLLEMDFLDTLPYELFEIKSDADVFGIPSIYIRPKQADPYELFRNKKGEWEWRKRGKNRRILNHRYNTKQAAIKGMKADYDVTVGMGGFDWKEVEG